MLPGKGIPKLGEEASELAHAVLKKIAYWHVDYHPDGFSLKEKIEDEAGDTLGALYYAVKYFGLDYDRIIKRAEEKFKRWEKKENTEGFL